MLAKAVAVAVGAPEDVLPPGHPAGSVGLLYMYVSVVASMIGCAATHLVAHALVEEIDEAAGAPVGARDEEAAMRTPLLAGATAKAGSGTADGGGAVHSGGDEAGKDAGEPKAKPINRKTVMELVSMSRPDSPVLLAAFAAGAAAAIFQVGVELSLLCS